MLTASSWALSHLRLESAQPENNAYLGSVVHLLYNREGGVCRLRLECPDVVSKEADATLISHTPAQLLWRTSAQAVKPGRLGLPLRYDHGLLRRRGPPPKAPIAAESHVPHPGVRALQPMPATEGKSVAVRTSGPPGNGKLTALAATL